MTVLYRLVLGEFLRLQVEILSLCLYDMYTEYIKFIQFVEPGPFWEADICSLVQEIAYILWNMKDNFNIILPFPLVSQLVSCLQV
jgi:hypothetical protein